MFNFSADRRTNRKEEKKKRDMNRTIRILTLLAVMVITAGQAWADEPTYGKIHYTNGSTDGGTLTFYTDADCSADHRWYDAQE